MGFWITLALFAVTTVLQELFRPKPEFENARPANLGDFRFPTASEDRVVPLVWGTVRLDAPNVVWYGDLRQIPIRVRQKTGLFSSVKQTVGYRYNVGIQMALCQGTLHSLRRVWYGERELVSTPQVGAGTIAINLPEFNGGDDLGNGGLVGDLVFYTGSPTQTADAYLSGFQVIGGGTPAYRGSAYVVWAGGYVGNSTNIKPFKFEVRRIPDGLDLATAHLGQNDINDHIINDADANPANVVYEILTDTNWGMGVATGDIDLASFRTAGGTLANEGNGVSMTIDSARNAVDVLREVERQMDGFVYFEHSTSKWKINLSRAGYVIGSLPLIDDSTALDVSSFTRADWEDTTNDVRVMFADRGHDYKEVPALAQDMANVELQGGLIVSATENYPGVKDADLANSIAWRTLRTLSYPLARLQVTVDRSMYDVVPGDVVAYSSERLGISLLPFRVQRIDYGDLMDGRITLDLVQDLFEALAGSYSAPPGTNWDPPEDVLVAIPADEQVVIEAPRALIVRDPDTPDTPDRIWAGGRYQGDGAVDFRIYQNSSGSYLEDGVVSGFLLIGELNADVSAGTTNPTGTTIVVAATPDTEAELIDAFTVGAGDSDTGLSLVNLIYVGGEFMGVQAVSDGGTNLVDLDTVYRGMLDSVPSDHAAGTPVYLVMVAGGLSQTPLDPTGSVSVKLRTRSQFGGELAEGTATTIALTFEDRYRSPYPPTNLELNTVDWQDPVDLDTLKQGGTAGNHDHLGIDVEYTRRDFRVLDEVQNILVDAVTRDPNFATATGTEYRVRVIEDPDGTPTTIITGAWQASAPALIFVSRTTILRNMPTPGEVPARLRVEVDTRHTIEGDVVPALVPLGWSFDIDTSDLDDDFNYGNLDQNVSSANWTAPASGTYTVTIGTAFSAGNVQVNVNSGGFTNVITAGNVSGTFSATAGDTIAIRHTSGDAGIEKFCLVDAPSGTVNAYAVFIQ